MKNIKLLTVCILTSLLISACGNKEVVTNPTNPSTTETVEKTNNSDSTENSSSVESESTSSSEESEKKEDDIWTYYNDAKWEDNFKGLESKILKVVVSDIAPRLDDQTKRDASVVGVKFELNNTTTGKFTTYPDQAVLVTSTGEQIDMPNVMASDSIGGEIDEGVKKEGNLIWYLKRGNAKDIKWIKLTWNVHEGDESDVLNENRKEYEIKILLNK